MEYPEVEDWMDELAAKVDAATGEQLWSVDLVEGDERFAVDLNMVTSTRRMQDGPRTYADYVLGHLG